MSENMNKDHSAGKMDFTTFITNLMMQASASLGIIEIPGGGSKRDLAQAAAMIEILDMLKKKTEGNLSADENSLLEEILHQLRMGYVSASEDAGNETTPPTDENGEVKK